MKYPLMGSLTREITFGKRTSPAICAPREMIRRWNFQSLSAAARAVPAGDRQIHTARDFVPQLGRNIRGMLQVGIHHAKNAPLGELPAANDRAGEAALALPSNHAEARKFLGQPQRAVPSAVRAVVIYHDDFVSEIPDGI